MVYMPTKHLTLKKCGDGIWRTWWTDDAGGQHGKADILARGKSRNAL